MAFGEDFLKGFFGTDYLKDYTHASKTFRSNGYELAPRQKFLFHVYFNINTIEIPKLADVFNGSDRTTLSLTVKSVDLPRFEFDVDVMNQYNRKRLVQSKITYNPVQVVFHDDGSDLVRNMWYNYYSYYYKDPTQSYWSPSVTNGSMGQSGNGAGDPKMSYNSRDIYSDDRTVNDWGYVGESYSDGTASRITGGKPPFFRDITIYGFNQHKFASYVLINPMIAQWAHDTYDYSEDGGIMQNTMTIQYETVKYYNGALSGQTPDPNVPGFADPAHYDTVKSPLARPGSTSSVLGQGGLIDAVGGIVSDLQSGSVAGIVGAVQKAGTAYGTFKGKDLKSIIKEEGTQVLQDVIKGELPGATKQAMNAADGFFFPKETTTGPTPNASSSSSVAGPSTPKSADPENLQGPVTARTPGTIST